MKVRGYAVKFGIFVFVMLLVNAGLVLVFGQMRGGDERSYAAHFVNASGLKPGDKVRIAGVPVGSVGAVEFGDDHLAHVTFGVDSKEMLTVETRAAVRYQDLVGNRYLELLDSPGTAEPLPSGHSIPTSRTAPALDLDALLGGFRPLFQALDPAQVNALSMSLLEVFQGQSGTVASVLAHTGSVTNTLADRDQLIGRVIDNLDGVLSELRGSGEQFSDTLDHLQQLVSGLASDKELIGNAVTSVNTATGTFADLLAEVRPDIRGTLSELDASLNPLIDQQGELDRILASMPSNYRQLIRVGAYGSFFNFYLCGIALKVDGADGHPLTVDLIDQTTGRCAPR
ncbi:MlaD family protein [Rhodococcus sp. IEGM 1379]|uniref:MCE family protein n=1 Tax=Rhodococcus sp. IEGM 1379 TaxID=3047086 RepID=UPI0024B6741A|nr:MlaD family protein [Rhodococcus sp. IEGM 1379]MDI9915534.1 MlaD family protein [Rhodococcus sp. IEGM 1379]